MLLRIDFEAFIKNNQPVDLRIDPQHDSNLDYIEKVNVNFASQYHHNITNSLVGSTGQRGQNGLLSLIREDLGETGQVASSFTFLVFIFSYHCSHSFRSDGNFFLFIIDYCTGF